MAKTAILLPGSIPKETIASAAEQYPHIEPAFIEQISNQDVKETVRYLGGLGCDLFIARGLQAQMITEMSSIPVVPLRITAQELGILIKEVCTVLNKERPKIALIGYSNMFCNIDHFEELFGVYLQRYLLTGMEEIDRVLETVRESGMDAVIGGRHCCEKAEAYGLRAFFASGGTEGLSETLTTAEAMCALIDTERNDTAQITAMVENNFNGILQVGRTNQILKANRVMQNILGTDMAELRGKNIRQIIPDISQKQLNNALYGGEETFSSMLLLNNVSYAVNISPVKVSGMIESVILTFQEGRRIRRLDQELRRELMSKGYIAYRTFESAEWISESMLQIRNTAEKAAKYSIPVLITGEKGLEKRMLAECIHNESLVRSNSFVELECDSRSPEIITELLFGNEKDPEPCLCELAQDGTLYLKNAECLNGEGQFCLHKLIMGKRVLNRKGDHTPANVRVIVSCERDLVQMVEKGEFRSDLYYELSMIRLDLEPLRNRREDLRMYIRKFMQEMQKSHDRYIRLTRGAEELLLNYDWPGNIPQIRNICQKIIISSDRRDADETMIRRILDHSHPASAKTADDHAVIVNDRKAAEIILLLQKHQGSREKVAAELGISKTTLWRYMKKYGLQK